MQASAYQSLPFFPHLRSLLGSPAVQKDPTLYLKAVQKVIASMTLGVDVSPLFSDMIKVCFYCMAHFPKCMTGVPSMQAGSTQHFVQKKLVYLYLGNYAESNSDLALMTVNTLIKDFEDRNAMLRGLALRSLCALRYIGGLVLQGMGRRGCLGRGEVRRRDFDQRWS